ncbi:MAG TPA: LPS export ABC transporter periplasmic protein LptC, partial [Terriglobales bacterium]|nr:LPS export ABC transporter periplasmic protein LptC [Terriglobales bacterium]
ARLRRWFVAALVLVCVVVGATYLHLRHRVQNVRKQVQKLGIEVQQSANQFTISKSEQGRTIFKLQASKAVQFKEGGHTELHDVTITLYGRDSSRFDQVYGEAFDYDPQSGNVSSRGEVSIDLQSNPQGIVHPDQTAPHELKNPVHLKTSDLVFNKNTGDAWTAARIDFRVPQASGSAVGAKYVAKDTALTLESQIKIVMTGAAPGTILADRALLQKAPREIVLTHPHGETPDQQAQAEELTLFLNEDNALDHAVATGGVKLTSRDLAGEDARPGRTRASVPTQTEITAQRLDVNMKSNGDAKDAILSGDVQFHSTGAQALSGSSAKAIMNFGRNNVLSKVRADGGVKLIQATDAIQTLDGKGGRPSVQKQNSTAFEITSPAMDFFVADQRLTRGETIGAPEILLTQSTKTRASSQAIPATAPGSTHIIADKFIAKFDKQGQLSNVHGAANAKVVSPAAPQKGVAQPDRITTSDSIDAAFRPGTGIESVDQQGHFVYRSGTQQAFADNARYTPADQMLTLTGSPRIVDAGMETTSRTVRLNRDTGDASAQGDVKTSYSDLKAEPNGALLASSDPVHVTAQSMSARTDPAIATYTGNARLWQNANVIEAPSIQFHKEQRTVVADAKGNQLVSTVLVGTDKKGNATPVTVTSAHLVYKDSDRKVHFDGGVTVRGTDLTITAKQMDVFLAQAASTRVEAGASSPVQNQAAGGAPVLLLPSAQSLRAGSVAPQSQAGGAAGPHTPVAPQSKLDKIVASGSVVITEPNRRATGENLTYTASDDKFVLTGGPPSIFDAEHGKITAVSLTLFRRDGRVVVEGDKGSPAVTETKVVR